MTARKPKRARELLTEDQYVTLLALQGGRCAICRRPPKVGGRRLSVDHDHASGQVRGLLCFRCNRGLPTYATASWLASAFSYVLRAELDRTPTIVQDDAS